MKEILLLINNNINDKVLKNIGEKNDFLFSWVDKNIKIKRLNSKSKNRSLQRIYENLLLNSENNKDLVQKPKTKEIILTDKNHNYSTNLFPTKNEYIKKNNKKKLLKLKLKTIKIKKLKTIIII